MRMGTIRDAEMQNYSEKTIKESISGDYIIDLSASNVFSLTLSGDSTLVFANQEDLECDNLIIVLQQNEVGNFNVTWPENVKWTNGVIPVITKTPNAVDVLVFFTIDGGNIWFASMSIKNAS